jgi:hypothetical protein
MWAFVSNEFQGIVKTKDTLKLYSAIYSYPAFKKVRDEREAHEYIAEKKRSFFSGSSRNMAWIKESGHIRMEYFIQDNSVYANLYTDKFGYVYLSNKRRNMRQTVTYDLIKVKLENMMLKDDSIQSHCYAIMSILNLFSGFINVVIIVPDLSVFLALTQYTGKNKSIRMVQEELKCREGRVALVLDGKSR